MAATPLPNCQPGEGIDTVRSTASSSLGANLENLILIGLGNLNGSGNNLNNTLVGTSSNNLLLGGAGDDFLNGKGGRDSFDGGAGNDTVTYAEATSGVIANLETGITRQRLQNSPSNPLKIMPLGDSNTRGKDADIAGYRDDLWNLLLGDGFSLDFVGSQSRGPVNTDPDHEGHGGWTIGEITGSVNGWLNTYQPNVALLMIGTNDVLQDLNLGNAPNRLSNLIDQITNRLPGVQLLVSSIPPIARSAQDQQQVQAFNATIPGIVQTKVDQNKKVTFVDIFPSLSSSDFLEDAIHFNENGYNKIANTWHNVILNLGEDQNTLTSIENVVGSAFNDILVGNTGANVLEGGQGHDILTGSGGADSYVLRGPNSGIDTITDFSASDQLRISASGFGGGLVAGIALSTSASATGVFVSGPSLNPLGTSANFLYNTSTGTLSFDRDGVGSESALVLALLSGSPALSASSFSIIA
ncbi:GDSL-type esterase/lipase family protein [Leptolyngbya sp. FACHB-261]|uniref:GDSL-type esterase/lipase family protein n=1 Tax=Leptolyngbya sp. FACHB-261 TaxID=2692806 RepID=UPI0016881E1A|nr:GDSL-type esterase/lipase family protein [Leptolyngbya sp. FACHB-261]MBD2102616.1 hypothetical protein [Leptolyngbya sp. FACHB-261]